MSNVRSATLPVAGSIQVAPHAAEGLKQGLNRRQLR